MQQQRLPYLDYARVFVMYLVIFGHLLPKDDLTIRPYIYAFHMPFFFMVSGMLHKFKGNIQLSKYAATLLVPFVFFNILFLVLKPIMSWYGIWEGDISQHNSLGEYFTYRAIKGITYILTGKNGIDGPTWFLFALFWCKVGTDLILKNRYYIIPYLGLFYVSTFIANLLFIRQACMALPFYYIGYCIKDKDYINLIVKDRTTKKILISICLLALCIILTKINGRVSMIEGIYGKYTKYISLWGFYVNGFVGALSVLYLSTTLKKNSYVELFAKSLITILCTHNLFVYTYKNFSGWWYYLYNNLWIALIILIACVFIHSLLYRYIPFAIGKGLNNNYKK